MTGKKTKQTRRKYDATFKEEVLKMVASGRPVSEIAQALGVGENLIYRWKAAAKEQTRGTLVLTIIITSLIPLRK